MRLIQERARAWTAPFRRYERHISAAAMVLGFAADNFTFGRVDHPGPHIVFVAYLALAAISVAAAHALQARAERLLRDGPALPPDADAPTAVPPPSRLRVWMPAVTQFALGGLWSGFLVFYWRSAAIAAAWPFLLLLLAFLVGNEIFRKYHARLVFATLLFFFALYSYAIFVVPVFTGTMGVGMFVLSGAIAIAVFLVYLGVLNLLGRSRYRQSRLKILGGAAAISAIMNLFYFTGVLPPLPLALSDVGIYQSIRHTCAVTSPAANASPGWCGSPRARHRPCRARSQTRALQRGLRADQDDDDHLPSLAMVGSRARGGGERSRPSPSRFPAVARTAIAVIPSNPRREPATGGCASVPFASGIARPGSVPVGQHSRSCLQTYGASDQPQYAPC